MTGALQVSVYWSGYRSTSVSVSGSSSVIVDVLEDDCVLSVVDSMFVGVFISMLILPSESGVGVSSGVSVSEA